VEGHKDFRMEPKSKTQTEKKTRKEFVFPEDDSNHTYRLSRVFEGNPRKPSILLSITTNSHNIESEGRQSKENHK
jgi:hypothetical protein